MGAYPIKINQAIILKVIVKGHFYFEKQRNNHFLTFDKFTENFEK